MADKVVTQMVKEPVRIVRALFSVSDTSWLSQFVAGLHQHGVEILSSGGTATTIESYDIPGLQVIKVADYTGFPEILDGRVKTLHPKVHGALLAKTRQPSHQADMAQHKIVPINLLVVNYYRFAETIRRKGCTLAEALENIDVGGPTMARAAVKNYEYVAVLTDPLDYLPTLEEMDANDGCISYETRLRLAQKAFRGITRYDAEVNDYLQSINKL